MPTYEYACTSCGEHLEVVQSFRDEPLTRCPACGGPLRKVFGSIGVVFKGRGFYKTDSRPAAKAASGATGDGAGSSSATGSDSPASTSKAADTKAKESGSSGGDGGSAKGDAKGSSEKSGKPKTTPGRQAAAAAS